MYLLTSALCHMPHTSLSLGPPIIYPYPHSTHIAHADPRLHGTLDTWHHAWHSTNDMAAHGGSRSIEASATKVPAEVSGRFERKSQHAIANDCLLLAAALLAACCIPEAGNIASPKRGGEAAPGQQSPLPVCLGRGGGARQWRWQERRSTLLTSSG